jgi:hypothetical protein
MPLAVAVVHTLVFVVVAIAAPGDSNAPIALQGSGRRNLKVAVRVSKYQMLADKGIHECW